MQGWRKANAAGCSCRLARLPARQPSLRAEGWVAVAQLTEDDSAEAQICTHVLSNGRAEPV